MGGTTSARSAAAADSTGAVRPVTTGGAGAAPSRAAVVPWRNGVSLKPGHSSVHHSSSSGHQQSEPASGKDPAVGVGKEAMPIELAKGEFVVLEEAEIEWDAADMAAVKRHSRKENATLRADTQSDDEEDCDGHVWRRPSGTAPAASVLDP